MAIVKAIQVCGGKIHKMLSEACLGYLECITEGTDREKINFAITLANGETKHITIRQEDDRVVAYGDFEELPDAIEYAQGRERNKMATKTVNPEVVEAGKEIIIKFTKYVLDRKADIDSYPVRTHENKVRYDAIYDCLVSVQKNLIQIVKEVCGMKET